MNNTKLIDAVICGKLMQKQAFDWSAIGTGLQNAGNAASNFMQQQVAAPIANGVDYIKSRATYTPQQQQQFHQQQGTAFDPHSAVHQQAMKGMATKQTASIAPQFQSKVRAPGSQQIGIAKPAA